MWILMPGRLHETLAMHDTLAICIMMSLGAQRISRLKLMDGAWKPDTLLLCQ